MTDKESSESYSSTDSYYHCKDIRYPVCNLALPDLYERHKTLDTDNGVTWHLPSYRLTYNQIYEQAQSIAKGLLATGLKEGDVVLSFGSDCPDSLLLFVAGSLIGLVFFAAYLPTPFEKNIAHRINKLKPKMILAGSSMSGYGNNVSVGPSVFKVLADLSEELLKDVHLFTDRQYLSWREDAQKYTSKSAKDCVPFMDLLDMGGTISDQRLTECMASMTPSQPCYIVGSSGSTGEPKLILHSAKFLVNCGGVVQQERGLRTKHTRYGVADICAEDTAPLESVMGGFYIGYETVIMPRPNTWELDVLSTAYLASIEEQRITMCYADQSVLSNFVYNPDIMKDYDISCLSALELGAVGASAAFKSQLLHYFPDSMDSYGMSECWYISTTGVGGLKSTGKLNKVGRPMINSEIKIVDENGNCVSRNERGEICIRSSLMMVEYLGQPELTKSVLTDDGWFRTGDCGVLDDDNDLQIVGRLAKSERFKVYGEVVYAQAIEFSMKNMVEIETIAVIGRDLGCGDGHELSYCIKAQKEKNLTAEQVFEYAKENLYSHTEWPVRVFFYDKFPRSGGRNKISRDTLCHEIAEKVKVNANDGVVNPYWLA